MITRTEGFSEDIAHFSSTDTEYILLDPFRDIIVQFQEHGMREIYQQCHHLMKQIDEN
jgi:hypothetical protein